MSRGGAKLLAKTASGTDAPQTLRMVAGALANLCGNGMPFFHVHYGFLLTVAGAETFTGQSYQLKFRNSFVQTVVSFNRRICLLGSLNALVLSITRNLMFRNVPDTH